MLGLNAFVGSCNILYSVAIVIPLPGICCGFRCPLWVAMFATCLSPVSNDAMLCDSSIEFHCVYYVANAINRQITSVLASSCPCIENKAHCLLTA